jgi:signal transduction histidine kinase
MNDGGGDRSAPRVLLVEDNPTDVLIVRETLAAAPAHFDVASVSTLREALDHLGAASVDVVMLDLGLPDSQGLETLGSMTKSFPELAIVVVTGLKDDEVGVAAVRQGAQDYVNKGEITAPLLARALRYAMERKQAEVSLRRSEERLMHVNDTLEQRVRERTEQLRALAIELTDSEESQRRRLAQVLHDHLQQLLVAAKLNISAAQQNAHQEQSQLLASAEDLLGQSLEACRSLTVELSPPVLYDQGLDAAVHWLAERTRELHGLEVRVAVTDAPHPDDHVSVLVFQSVRELLLNVVKHAGVQHAQVRLWGSADGKLHVAVEDGGKGFDAAATLERRHTGGGFGLFSIRERLDLVGGRIQIESRPGLTRVRLDIPLRSTPATCTT